MSVSLYILDADHVPVLALNASQWGAWFDDIANRRVAITDLSNGWTVTTVFLGVDTGFDDGLPLLFETMAYRDDNGAFDDYQERYATWDEAVAGHARAVEEFRGR